MAEAYGVPCVWVELREHFLQWDFKYRDFYESIGKTKETPVLLYKEDSHDEIERKVKEWKQGHIDFEQLEKLIPFM